MFKQMSQWSLRLAMLIGVSGSALLTASAADAPAQHQEMMRLAAYSGCFSCHSVDPKFTPSSEVLPVGPSYRAISKRYQNDPNAFDNLLVTVRRGSNPYDRHWQGDVSGLAMPPNVALKEQDARRLVQWILDLERDDPDEMLQLAAFSGCLTCHSVEPKHTPPDSVLPVGPSYREVAARYSSDPQAYDKLYRAVKQGSSPYDRHWQGKVSGLSMPPNVNVDDANTGKLVRWILSLHDAQ